MSSPNHRHRRSHDPSTLVVVDHRDGGNDLGRLLERVTGAIGRNDRVVVWSDDPGLDGPRRRFPRLRFEPRPSSGWAAALAELADGHTGAVCVVEDRAVPADTRWLRELLEPLQRDEADIAVPATNAAPHPSAPADCPVPAASPADIRRAAQACRNRPDRRHDVAVHGPVAAFAPGVVARLTGAGLDSLDTGSSRVVELPRLYVHARSGVPLVSVCLIVKDEEAELLDCIESVRPIADEIVIYDTGSGDGSVQLARSLGATVIEGTWRKDFAWARNQALDAARGAWILSIDADERLEIDPGFLDELLAVLREDPPVDRFVLELNDLQGSVHAPVRSPHRVPMARLFRRDRCRWFDALHEQPKTRPGQPEVRNLNLDGMRFLHRGYLEEYVKGRDKVARNLEVVLAGRDTLPETAKESFDLGRSLRSAGQHARAFAMFERALELSDNVVLTRAALEFAITALCETGQAPAAQPLLDQLHATPGGEGPARFLQASIHLQHERWDEVLACLDGLTKYNDNFTSFREDTLWTHRALAHRGLGRPDEAADAATEALLLNDQALPAWQILFESDDDARLRRVAATIAPDRLVPLFAKLSTLPATARDRLADAVWQVRPGDRVVLAVASQLAGSLEADRTIEWSGRLRSHGLTTLCPLRTAADDTDRPANVRAGLLARAVHELGADDLTDDLEEVVATLDDDDMNTVLETCLADWRAAAGSVIVAGATSAARCVGIVEALEAAGFVDEALAVVRHGAQLDADELRRLVSARPALATVLRRAAEASGRDDLGPVLVPAA